MKHKPDRWILHVDMDAFFASVEQLDDPALRGKPVIVGGEQRGVVSAASYEARAFGVHSAMPIFQAKKLCPQGIFVRGSRHRYSEKSREVMAVLREFSPLVEPASIDEAFLDLTGLERIYGDIIELAGTIQKEVSQRTQLSCSVGLAPVKFLAKIASDLDKPGGVSILRPGDIERFMKTLPVGKIPGVGKRTLDALAPLGVRLASDVFRYPEEFWARKLGKAGEALYKRAQGIDTREVDPYGEQKSESAENTFLEDTLDQDILATWLLRQSERVGTSLRKNNIKGRTITLKVKYADFTQLTRSKTLAEGTNTTKVIYETALELLHELNPTRRIRLIGCGVSNFGEVERQLSLFESETTLHNEREVTLDTTIDKIRNKFGSDGVIRGKLFKQ